jgi:tetratricopeptide (TPR) repeat protein
MAKKEKTEDLLENPEVIKEKFVSVEHWVENNPKIVVGVVAVLVVVVGAYFGYRYYVGSQNEVAQSEMFQAVRYFEMDSLNLAMKGDGNNLGFEQIVEDYPMTDAGNLAHYYAGVIALKQGKFQLAVLYLEDFSSNDILIQARAYSLKGDAHMELKEYEQAAAMYHKASNYKPNKYFTPTYLMKEALAYELLQQNDKAIAAYERIITEFWDSAEVQNAKKFKARLDNNS